MDFLLARIKISSVGDVNLLSPSKWYPTHHSFHDNLLTAWLILVCDLSLWSYWQGSHDTANNVSPTNDSDHAECGGVDDQSISDWEVLSVAYSA